MGTKIVFIRFQTFLLDPKTDEGPIVSLHVTPLNKMSLDERFYCSRGLTWHTLLVVVVVGVGGGALSSIVFPSTNPGAEVVERHLLNEGCAILSEVPPLKNLQGIKYSNVNHPTYPVKEFHV